MRIPLIDRGPGVQPRTVDTPCITMDWVPTLMDYGGIPRDPQERLEGISLRPLLEGGELPPRLLWWHFPHYTNQGGRPGGAIRDGAWKLIEHYENGQLELFHLADDPGETEDRSVKEPARARTLLSQLTAFRNAAGAKLNLVNPDFDAAAHAKLYRDVDVSRLRPAATAAETAAPLREWRQAMDAAVQ